MPFLITAITLNSLVKWRNNWKMPIKTFDVDKIIIEKNKIFFRNKNDVNCYYISDIFRMPAFLSRIIYRIFGPLHVSSKERKMIRSSHSSPSYYYSLGDCFAFFGLSIMTLIFVMNILR